MRGVPCVIPGTLEIEGRKKASELISEVRWNSKWGMVVWDPWQIPQGLCVPLLRPLEVKLSPFA